LNLQQCTPYSVLASSVVKTPEYEIKYTYRLGYIHPTIGLLSYDGHKTRINFKIKGLSTVNMNIREIQKNTDIRILAYLAY